MAKRERVGRIFVDYLRNGRGSTAAAAYSTRARPDASISMPVEWSELDALGSGDHFTLANSRRRLDGLASDPWAGMGKLKQHLPRTKSRAPRNVK
jgi:bifunctional non-homologous end joining protein LigD